MIESCRHCGKPHGRSGRHDWAMCRECGELPWLCPDDIVDCTVMRLNPFVICVQLGERVEGILHISQLFDPPKEPIAIGDVLRAKVIAIDCLKQRVSLRRIR